MKNYIWEKAFKRTWLSTHWNKFDQGILEVVTYIRLSGGETRDIWYGYHGDFSENDKEFFPQDKYVLPYIYFYFKEPPYYKYEREVEVVEKVVKEKNITIQNYLDWVHTDDSREKAEGEYEKSMVTKEWQEWENSNGDFLEKLIDLASQFNNEYKEKDFVNWQIMVWELSKGDGLLCFSVITDKMDLHAPNVQSKLTKEKREELHKIALRLFQGFGEFLKNKFVNSL